MARYGRFDTAIIGLEGRGWIHPTGKWAQVGDFWAVRSAWAWTVRAHRAAEEDEVLPSPRQPRVGGHPRGTPYGRGDTLMEILNIPDLAAVFSPCPRVPRMAGGWRQKKNFPVAPH